MIMSIDIEKSFDKIQHPFMTEKNNLSKLGVEGNVLNLIKITKQLMSYLIAEILYTFPLSMGTSKGSLITSIQYYTVGNNTRRYKRQTNQKQREYKELFIHR